MKRRWEASVSLKVNLSGTKAKWRQRLDFSLLTTRVQAATSFPQSGLTFSWIVLESIYRLPPSFTISRSLLLKKIKALCNTAPFKPCGLHYNLLICFFFFYNLHDQCWVFHQITRLQPLGKIFCHFFQFISSIFNDQTVWLASLCYCCSACQSFHSHAAQCGRLQFFLWDLDFTLSAAAYIAG